MNYQYVLNRIRRAIDHDADMGLDISRLDRIYTAIHTAFLIQCRVRYEG